MIRIYTSNPSGSDSGNGKNALDPKSALLQSIYGKWWMMFIEALGLVALAVYALALGYLQTRDNSLYTSLPSLSTMTGAFIAVMGIAYVVLSYRIDASWLLKLRGFVQTIIGIILMNPVFAYMFVFMFGFWAVIVGMNLIFSGGYSGKSRMIRIVTGVILLACTFSAFSVEKSAFYFNVFALAFFAFAIYLLTNLIGFRRAVKEKEDEERGFTDYSIE